MHTPQAMVARGILMLYTDIHKVRVMSKSETVDLLQKALAENE